MTITNENSRNDYVSNGVAVEYAFTFKILAEEQVQVVVADADGLEEIQTLTTDYTVELDSSTGLGSITFLTAPTSGFKISLLRNMDFEQNTQLQNQGTSQFSGLSFETALDKLTLLALQLKETIGRNISLKKTSLESGIVIDDPVDGKLLMWDESANAIVNVDAADVDLTAVTAFWKTILQLANASESRDALGLEIGVDVQAFHANLAALAGLTGAADKIPYFSGAGAMGLANLSMGKNAIINGAFDVWQGGTSFSSAATGTRPADCWIYIKSGSMVHDISRSTDVPTVAEAGRKFNYSLKIDCTTIDGSLASSDFAVIEHRVEGYNWLPLAQKAGVLSFWVKAPKTGVYGAYLKNSINDRCFVGEITVNSANTWEKKVVSYSASPSAGTWNYTDGIGLSLGLVLAAGTDHQTTANSWQTGGYLTTSSQVNACDSTSNDLYLCGVQLEEGSVATPFESRSFQQELALCQRYYQKSYQYSTSVGSATLTGAFTIMSGSNFVYGHSPIPVHLRSSPTLRYWDAAGNLSKITLNGADNSSIGAGSINATERLVAVDIAPTVAADKKIIFHYELSSVL